MNELKFAFRQSLKNPGFTAVAVLTLALDIGANTVPTLASSSRADCQSLIDLDFGTFAVETQDLRGIENLNADQFIGGAVVEEHIFIGSNGRDFSSLLRQVNVSRVHFGIVSNLHKFWLKVEGQDRDHHVMVGLLRHDRHHLLGSIVFAFPRLFKPQVQPESKASLFRGDLTASSDGFLHLLPAGSTLEHALLSVMAEMNGFHVFGADKACVGIPRLPTERT
jgi:hypothetical protein